MSWRDRDWNRDESFGSAGRPGGDWRGLLPRLDNPMSWSVWMGRVAGIDVRIHLILLIFILAELFRGLFGAADRSDGAPLDLFFTIVMLGSLFIIILLHEFGHCFACRAVGGEANEILMWPLGGLAYCIPPHHWRAHLVTVAGGPLVNVALIPILGVPLWLASRDLLVAAPLPFGQFPGWWLYEESFWMLGLYLAARVNMILLLFNLLPMFPLDGGRFMQSLLWRRMGYVRSMRIAVYTGYFAAIALVIYGWVTHQLILIGVAIFGGFTCWLTIRQLRFTQEVMGFDSEDYLLARDEDKGASRATMTQRASKRQQRKAEKLLKERQEEERELDRLLKKIADSGMGSLSRSEKKWLERQSKNRRKD